MAASANLVDLDIKDSTGTGATNMRTALTITIAILALIFGITYQWSQQGIVVQPTTQQSHE
jgi:hypothetical protein